MRIAGGKTTVDYSIKPNRIIGSFRQMSIISFSSSSLSTLFTVNSMAEHIDRTRLNTDLRYRFDYLSKVLDFTSTDIAILNQISTIIQPLIPVIVDQVYRKLFSFDITKQYLVLRHSCLANILPTDFHLQGLEYRKNMLSDYLKHVFTEQQWNETFLDYLSSVARIHTDQAGSPAIQVDHIHVNIFCGLVEQILLDIILKNSTLNQQIKSGAVLAINKFFWIQNNIFSMNYGYDF